MPGRNIVFGKELEKQPNKKKGRRITHAKAPEFCEIGCRSLITLNFHEVLRVNSTNYSQVKGIPVYNQRIFHKNTRSHKNIKHLVQFFSSIVL